MRCPKCGDELIWSPKNLRHYCCECETCPVPRDISEKQFTESVPRELKRIADVLWIFVYMTLAVLIMIGILLAGIISGALSSL